MNLDARSNEAARADLCRLLAACYYQPAPEFAEEQLFDHLRDAARALDPSLEQKATRLGAAFARQNCEDLLVEYTRLFLGPTGAPAKPYGSVWLDAPDALMRDSTVAVARLYEQAGLQIADDFREVPDHIAAELEFLYLLILRRAAALLNDDGGRAGEVTALERTFLREHLGAWIGDFAHALASAARTDFYRELATLTESFVRSEAARVSR